MKTQPGSTLEHVRQLAAGIGSRPIGTPANLAAAQYIGRVFEGAGLSVSTQEFSCPCWFEDQASLEFNGEPLEAFANTFSPSCDLVAPMVAVCTLAELEVASISGHILVLYGLLAQGELATKGGIYISDHDRRVMELLEANQPAGIVTVNPTLHGHWRLIEDFELNVPSVTVSARSGLKLLQCPGVAARLKIIARRSPSHSSNIVGRLSGTAPAKMVLCAHYDTKVDTPGAYDNATGVAVILTLAERLSHQQHEHTLEFVAFSGEEGAGLGDMEYARRDAGGFDQITAALNFDGVGPFTGTTTAAVFAASPRMEAALDHLISERPRIARVEPWPASDHYIFYSHGTPSVAFTSTGIRDIYHTPSDTLEWISAEKLIEVVDLAAELINMLDPERPRWSRPHGSK